MLTTQLTSGKPTKVASANPIREGAVLLGLLMGDFAIGAAKGCGWTVGIIYGLKIMGFGD